MAEPNLSPASLVLLDRIAGAIRDELGRTIDAYPGCRSPEGADPINCVFRVVTRSLARGRRDSRDGPRRHRLAGPPTACQTTAGGRGLR
jgi:hypothetical protein